MNTAHFLEFYYNNAEVNSILIMDSQGTILNVNQAFTKSFGYKKEDIQGKNFNLLFLQQDQEKQRPQHALTAVLSKGQAHDENYIIDKDGHAI